MGNVRAVTENGKPVNVGDRVLHFSGFPQGVFEGVVDPIHPGIIRVDGRDWPARAFKLRIEVVP